VPGVEFALSRDEARWIAVTANRLDRRPFRRQATAADVLEMIRYLRIVQLDTISVISRSHETVLWSRLGRYDPAIWPTLYESENALTEYFAHVAAIIPREDLRLMRQVMEHFRRPASPTGIPRWHADPANRAVMDDVLSHIAAEGPAASWHFERPDDGRVAEQWEWYGVKPERQALEMLWLRGETALRQRDKGFRRVFDLIDRVMPRFWDEEPIPRDEVERTFIRTAMRVLGVATAKWVADYYRSGTPHVPALRTRAILSELEERGELLRVTVPGIAEPVWLDTQYVELVEDLRRGRRRPTLTTFLSPFDNLVWNRDRDEKLFDFEYRIECYTPAPKRRYGYYTLPILYRGRIVGRLDPSYDRRKRFLTIKSLHLEPGVRPSQALVSAIAWAIEDLLRFLGGQLGDWRLLVSDPPQILADLRPGIETGGAEVDDASEVTAGVS
jgi:uncharacterized protein